MKRLLWLLLTAAAYAQLPTAVIILPQPFTPYVTILRNVDWKTSAGNYLYQPVSPDIGTCVYVQNNDATARSLVNLRVLETVDPSFPVINPGVNNPAWQEVQAVPQITSPPLTIAGNLGSFFYFPTIGAAGIDVAFLADPSANPGMKVSLFAVQTNNCGGLPISNLMGLDATGAPSPTSLLQCNSTLTATVTVATSAIVIPTGTGQFIRICAFSVTVKTTVTTPGTYVLLSGHTGNCTVNPRTIWAFDLGVAVGSGIYIGGNNGQLNSLTFFVQGTDAICLTNNNVTAGNVTITLWFAYTKF